MLLKKFIFYILLFLVSIESDAQPLHIKLRFLEGYYANEKMHLKNGVNYMVISNERLFEKYFGKIDKKEKPNFDFEHVVIMMMRPTRKQYFLSFNENAIKAGNYIEIYCNVRKEKHELPYFDHPIAIAAIPKYFSVNKINFYSVEEHKLMESVAVKAR